MARNHRVDMYAFILLVTTYTWTGHYVCTASDIESDRNNILNIGVVDTAGELDSVRQALSLCAYRDVLRVTPLPMVDNTTCVLQQAETLKEALIDKEYFAVIGPLLEPYLMTSELLEFPYLSTQSGYEGTVRNIHFLLPQHSDVIKCVTAIVGAYDWKAMGLLWESDVVADEEERWCRMFHPPPYATCSLNLIVFKDFGGGRIFTGVRQTLGIDLRMFRIRHSSDQETQIRDALHALRLLGIKNVLLMTEPETTMLVINVARRLGIMAVPYSWLIVSDGSLTELETSLEDLLTNVTVIQVREIEATSGNLVSREENMAISDAITVICEMVAATGRHNILPRVKFDNMLEEVQSNGTELSIVFDEHGMRQSFAWNIFSHSSYQFNRIGEWSKGRPGEESQLIFLPHQNDTKLPWSEKKADVVIILEKPWSMLKPGMNTSCRGNDCYEGFLVDLMVEVAKQPMFDPPLQYELYVVPDGAFGKENRETGEWNGLMGQIMAGDASMAIAPLSINKEREEAVDFTKPFKTRGISVLIKTPESHNSFFQFLAPLSYKVWGTIVLTFLIVSAALAVYEKSGTKQRSDMLKITGHESCWFVFGSLVQEGTESTPVTIAGRILIAAWWFFVMILISSYTANLAAFLTVKKINAPIESISDLALQSKIKYGTVRHSGIVSFFEKTVVEPYRTMWLRMGLENLVDNTTEGLRRVQEGNYAFLWDSTVLSYVAATDCNYTEIGPPVDPKGYGIGVPSGATYRENLTLAVLSLADSGIIDKLEHIWWKPGECKEAQRSSSDTDETQELQLVNVAGIFFVVIGGLTLGLIACIIDRYCPFCIRKRERQQRRKETNHNNLSKPVPIALTSANTNRPLALVDGRQYSHALSQRL